MPQRSPTLCVGSIQLVGTLAALNAEFQHFKPKFNKTSLLYGPHSKRGKGWKKAQKQGEDEMTLIKTLVSEGFFFKFCDVAEVTIVHRQFSQIWTQENMRVKDI